MLIAPGKGNKRYGFWFRKRKCGNEPGNPEVNTEMRKSYSQTLPARHLDVVWTEV